MSDATAQEEAETLARMVDAQIEEVARAGPTLSGAARVSHRELITFLTCVRDSVRYIGRLADWEKRWGR